MTILSCVFVPEGIVMAADSRVTTTIQYPDGKKHQYCERENEFKILQLTKRNVAISYHGETHIKSIPIAVLIAELESKYIQENDTVEDVSRKLHEFLLVNSGSKVCFIASGYDKDTPSVYTICEDKYVRNNYNNGSIIFGAIWRGDHSKVDELYTDVDIDFDQFPLKDSIEFAEKIVETSINEETIDGYHPCGGHIDILVFSKNKVYFHQKKSIN
ncbi:hypothetical protein BME96_09040 [Virgibacillus halodenitrificans]|uniref:Uncharacterized protein n=1 Tax=Virgibacillus halodenitrificans TaxID=1482 RepID=A0AAC9J0B0_VIRHA|nr:hypothetical protein [Virgibacillus halodenitrificans]APC48303.1 hypothetical protein BME96_09040 [Virgibacillus halodenitrificans]